MQKGIASMNINECYQAMGADYEEVFGRLRNEKLIAKFVLKFPDDPSFSQLKNSLAEKNTKEAFRAAHTLKGVAQNLGFTPDVYKRQLYTGVWISTFSPGVVSLRTVLEIAGTTPVQKVSHSFLMEN